MVTRHSHRWLSLTGRGTRLTRKLNREGRPIELRRLEALLRGEGPHVELRPERER